MSAKIQELKDINGTTIYPVSSAKAIYFPGKRTTVYDEMNSKLERSYVTSFESDGSIVTTYANGDTSTTTFNSDGSIVETYRRDGTEILYTTTTTFNADGSISTDVVYAEGVRE